MTNPKEKEIRERFLNEFIKPEMLNKPYVIADWWLKEIDTLLHSDREAVREIEEIDIKKLGEYVHDYRDGRPFTSSIDPVLASRQVAEKVNEIIRLLSPNK